jgi:hypothetical protein
MGVGGQHHTPVALPQERPTTHCTGDQVGLGASLDSMENLTPTRIRFLDCPARSKSLY